MLSTIVRTLQNCTANGFDLIMQLYAVTPSQVCQLNSADHAALLQHSSLYDKR
jgi:hypothetical protein